ncbi:MAG: hypothetical protein U0736_26285 [Gemmataceae bacterium]
MLHRDGRDELNLADFPISTLPRVQKSDEQGRKLDRMEFTATRYDPATRQRVRQKVILTSTAHDGLPTPADEHIILAALYVAKRTHDFADATVPFALAPGCSRSWAGRPTAAATPVCRASCGGSRRLTLRYENAWWDVVGRGYEEEVATGIVAGYRIARQVSGPRPARSGAAKLGDVDAAVPRQPQGRQPEATQPGSVLPAEHADSAADVPLPRQAVLPRHAQHGPGRVRLRAPPG